MIEDDINQMPDLTSQEEQELSVLLKTAYQPPPEGFMDEFMAEFSTRLEEETRPQPWFAKLARFVQTHKQFSAAVAVMVIAIVIPLSLPHRVMPVMDQVAMVEQKTNAPMAKRERAEAPPDPGAFQPPVAMDEMQPEPPISGFNYANNQSMNLGAARPPAVAEEAEDKLMVAKRPQARFTSSPIPPGTANQVNQGYNHQDFLVKQASLGVEVGDLQKSFQKVSDIVSQNKGYIVNSRMAQEENQQAVAEIQIKLPRESLLSVIAQIEAEGTVRHKEISSEDIWLQVQRKKLDIEYLEHSLKETKDPASRADLQRQIKEQKLEQMQFEQRLRMATLELRLFGPPPSRQWQLNPVSENARHKLGRSIRNTVDLLVEILVILPPILIYLACAFVLWLCLKWLLVVKTAILTEKALTWMYLLAVFFFPLSFAGEQEIQTVFLFVGVVSIIWALKTIFFWVREQMAEKKSLKIPDGEHDIGQ